MAILKIFQQCFVFENIFLIKINIISTAESRSDSTIIVKIQIKRWVINYCEMSKQKARKYDKNHKSGKKVCKDISQLTGIH